MTRWSELVNNGESERQSDPPVFAPEEWDPSDTSRIPTRYLGGAPDLRTHLRGGVSGAMPRVALAETVSDDAQAAVLLAADRATRRRRRLLAIFGRLMARFYERHERRWSMGRWDCSCCRRRIVAWAWVPHTVAEAASAMHEGCVSSRMWEVVLRHERLTRAGLMPQSGTRQFGMAS